ncbi:gluconate 2-dehydrogenase subunit 3 family protein [Oleiharenicola lentus]|jgi:hypothetical protein|uniref:Gluconate 2-dehydrogenase subunit 3 family protein n=1 Tax=Oleiharenicola lentus TaxID=2508720 RepID=A0A4Q1CB02_9BACT|nr:gluconate 2-dehydrogenase subunit 3 family protein [Oleiharenicola lentus]RXK56062.1 gluconate 2-dehydrogenase subunit 3 family protein [Oleiharenicola lentus]
MNPPNILTRREALARLSFLLGGALIGGDTWLRGATVAGKTIGDNFSATDIALLDEIAETIIPTTATPGAKAAGVGAFMAMMVTDCYDDAHHAAFRAGLEKLRAENFAAATPAARTARLNTLDAEQKAHTGTPAHFFKMMKQLTVLGYFTSEIGASQVLIYEEAPGRFDGNMPYKPGDRYFFTQPNRNL